MSALPFVLTPREEIERRIEGLRARMEEGGVEVALLVQNVDVFYFSGTLQRGYLVVPLQQEAVLFVQQDYERASLESPLRVEKVRGLRDLRGFRPLIQAKRVGLEFDVLPLGLFQRIERSFQGKEFLDISRDILSVRARKSPFEIEQLKRSGEIVVHVFSKVPELCKEGMAEVELDALLQAEGRRRGHQGWLRMRGLNQEMANIAVMAGESGAFPSYPDTPLKGYGVTHAIAQGASWRRIGRDEPIVVDYGGGYNGYTTDETRTFVIGRLPEPFKGAYEVALEVLHTFEAHAKAGSNGRDLYELCLKVVRRRGLQEYFMGFGEGKVKFIGHGIGLEINEWPIIARGRDEVLEEGMVFAFEPKFVFPGRGAVGVEVDYVVGRRGVERLTDFPIEVISL